MLHDRYSAEASLSFSHARTHARTHKLLGPTHLNDV